MKKGFIVLFFGITIATAFSKVCACDCVSYKLEQSIKLSGFIITGMFFHGDKLWELSESDKKSPAFYYTGRFIVRQILKGSSTIKIGDTLDILSDNSNCSSLYKNETNYILFAEDKKVKTITCSFTRALNDPEGKKIYKATKRLIRNS